MGMAEYDRALDVVGRCKEELDYISRVRIAAYHSMGRGFAKYYDKAVEEYEKMKDSATSDIKLLIEMSQIYQEKEEYEKSLELAKKLLDDFQLEYAWVLMMKAYAGMYDAGGVIYCGKKCLRTFPKLVYPYEEMAKVYYQTGHMDELRELLAKAKEQEIHSIYLNSYAYNGEEIPEGFDIDGELKSFNLFYHVQVTRSANLNAYKYGYPVISKFLRMYPCKALLNRRGLFSMDAKDTEKAMADFREILEEDPADAFAYNNIGCLYKYIGQYEEAITCFNKAIYYMYREDKPEPKDVHYGNLAHTYELLGAYDLALKNYLRIAEEFGKSNETMADLIANYGRCGQTADAKQLIDQRFYLDSNKYKKPFYHYRLHMYAGQWDEAGKYVEQYKQVIIYYTASDKTSALWANYYHMYAWQLILQKQYDEAMKVLEQAIEKSKTPSSRKKDKIDLLINKIFFLSLKQIKKEDVVEEPPKLSKSALFWSKVLSSKKAASEPIREMQDTRKEEEAKLEAEIQNTLEALNKVLDQMCRKQLNNKEPRNPIATQDFFYKERYVKYLEFILALYGEGVEAGEKALAAMEESPRCRLCNHGCCMRLKIARALLLEKQGHAKEAMAIYEQLAKEQPYNAFAQLRLLFAK